MSAIITDYIANQKQYLESKSALEKELPQMCKRMRKKRGMTLKGLAADLNVHISTVHKIESGDLVPGVDLLLRLDEAINQKLESTKESNASNQGL